MREYFIVHSRFIPGFNNFNIMFPVFSLYNGSHAPIRKTYNGLSGVPENFSGIPGNFSSVPENFSSLPGNFSGTPEKLFNSWEDSHNTLYHKFLID
jgi:hypothetical protein